MKSRSTKKLCITAAALAISIGVWGVGDVQAQQTTSLVPFDSISMEPNHRIPEGAGTAYAGIEECETLIDGDRTIEVFFETTVDMTLEDRFFGGVYHYHFDRGEAPNAFQCRSQDGDIRDDCAGEFDTDDYEILHDGVEVTTSFQYLTELDDPSICEEEEGQLDMEYFIQLRLRDTIDGEYQYGDVRVVLDLIRPEPPQLEDAFATQSTISVEFESSESDDVENHHVFYATESFEEGDLRDDIDGATSPRAVSGSEEGQISADLDPGDTVYVGMLSRDRAGNYSVASSSMEVTVIETRDFWDFYVDAGGEEEGGYGCQSGGSTTTGLAGMALLLLLFAGLKRRRIRRWSVAASCAVALVAFTAVDATAQEEYGEDTSGMFEFKLGPYQPRVDAEFDNGPYETFYGDSSMLYAETAVDYHLWQEIGKLSLGFHAGYGRVSGDTLDQDGNVVDLDETSSLRIIPLRTSLVYRYDYSAHHHNIPLVPVLKAGLNYTFWRASDPGGETSVVDDQRGSGGRPGWHATAGLHLHLDFFDPAGAAAFAMTWGIMNSYLFAEYTATRTFGDGINLGDNHWALGLGFEF